MSTRHTFPVLLFAAALLAQGAVAQTPVRPARFIINPNVSSQFLNGVAMDGAGNLTFLWTSASSTGEQVYTRRYSAADTPVSRAFRLEDPSFNADGGTVVANQRGDVLMTWSRTRYANSGPTQYFLRRTSPVLPTLTLQLKGLADVAVDRNGNFIVVWVASTPDGLRVFGQRYNFDGTTRGPEFNAASSFVSGQDHKSPSVAMNPKSGEFVVVWELRDTDGTGLGVYGQRFGFTTGRQGGQFGIFIPAVALRPSSIQPFAPQVARGADGRFVVIWRDLSAGEFQVNVLGQRYNNAGRRQGPQLVIVQHEDIPDSHPQIAMSQQGDFVVAWDDQGTSPAWFRLFHSDGTPAGPVIEQPPMGTAFYHGTGRVTYGWNGTFVYGWTNYLDEGPSGNTISFQRYLGLP